MDDDTQRQPVEPTIPFARPYGNEETYWTPIPPPPPPPLPRKRHKWLLLALLPVLLALLAAGVVAEYMFYRNDLQIVVQTVQPTQPHLYTAEDIYNAFVAAGLGGTIDNTPDTWSCCLYRPEGGSMRWHRSDGSQWEVASFINDQEAHDDTFGLSKQLETEGPGTMEEVGRCMLLSGPLSTDLIPQYENIMKKYC